MNKKFIKVLDMVTFFSLLGAMFVWLSPLNLDFDTVQSMAYKDKPEYVYVVGTNIKEAESPYIDEYSAMFDSECTINVNNIKIDTFANNYRSNVRAGVYKLLPPILKSDSKNIRIDIETNTSGSFITAAKLHKDGEATDITDKFKLKGNNCVVYQTMRVFEYENDYYALALVQDVNDYDEDYTIGKLLPRNTTSIKYFVLNLSKDSNPMIIEDSANDNKMFKTNKYSKALDQRGIDYLYAYPVEDTVQVVFEGVDQIKNKELVDKIPYSVLSGNTFIYLAVDKKDFNKFMDLLEVRK